MANSKQEFHTAVQISKLVVFEISYYTLGNNSKPYFSTCANKFCNSKRNFTICGQAQDELLGWQARIFWKKWDKFHSQDLTQEQYNELRQDIENLKNYYNIIEFFRTNENTGYFDRGYSFYQLAQFTKQTPKKRFLEV